jgi:hypothetical protein
MTYCHADLTYWTGQETSILPSEQAQAAWLHGGFSQQTLASIPGPNVIAFEMRGSYGMLWLDCNVTDEVQGALQLLQSTSIKDLALNDPYA